MFCKKGVLKNFPKFTVKHLCQSLFFNKVARLRPPTLLKKRLWHRCFTVNFGKFLRTPLFIKQLWWLLLKIVMSVISNRFCFTRRTEKRQNCPSSSKNIFKSHRLLCVFTIFSKIFARLNLNYLFPFFVQISCLQAANQILLHLIFILHNYYLLTNKLTHIILL